jgi:hypothetical protein
MKGIFPNGLKILARFDWRLQIRLAHWHACIMVLVGNELEKLSCLGQKRSNMRERSWNFVFSGSVTTSYVRDAGLDSLSDNRLKCCGSEKCHAQIVTKMLEITAWRLRTRH